jgi:hypothetical protein
LHESALRKINQNSRRVKEGGGGGGLDADGFKGDFKREIRDEVASPKCVTTVYYGIY